jgi:phosphotransferase system HPr (HPr) family protein
MRDLELMEMPPFNPLQDGDYWCQEIVVLNKHGLHARPSAKIFEKVLMPLGEELELHFVVDEHGQVPIKSVFDLMSLGLEQGTKVNLKLKVLGETENNPERSAEILSEIRELFLSFCDD